MSGSPRCRHTLSWLLRREAVSASVDRRDCQTFIQCYRPRRLQSLPEDTFSLHYVDSPLWGSERVVQLSSDPRTASAGNTLCKFVERTSKRTL